MEISTRGMLLFLMVIIGYIYLSDILKISSFQSSLIGVFNGTNHTMINFIANKTNSLAAIVSSTSVMILNSIPVNFFNYFFQNIGLILNHFRV